MTATVSRKGVPESVVGGATLTQKTVKQATFLDTNKGSHCKGRVNGHHFGCACVVWWKL